MIKNGIDKEAFNALLSYKRILGKSGITPSIEEQTSFLCDGWASMGGRAEGTRPSQDDGLLFAMEALEASLNS